DVGAVLKNDVNEGFAEHRLATDEFHFWRGDKDAGNRIRDLVFNEIGRASFPLRVNDHLHVTQIGNCIERRVDQAIKASGDSENGEDENEELIPRTPLNDTID